MICKFYWCHKFADCVPQIRIPQLAISLGGYNSEFPLQHEKRNSNAEFKFSYPERTTFKLITSATKLEPEV
jgi:hypothetical protein